MSIDSFSLKGDFGFSSLFKNISFKYNFRKNNPDFFYPSGTIVFCGAQGSGKTLSMVRYVRNLCKKYPHAILCPNMYIRHDDLPNEYVEWNGSKSLLTLENDSYGVIFCIDEIQTEFNSLESRDIGLDVITELSQQRKQRMHIVCTSQVFQRMAKPLREQAQWGVSCRNVGDILQINSLVKLDELKLSQEGKLEGKSFKKFFWIHNPEDYSCYDTYQKIQRFRLEKKEVFK